MNRLAGIEVTPSKFKLLMLFLLDNTMMFTMGGPNGIEPELFTLGGVPYNVKYIHNKHRKFMKITLMKEFCAQPLRLVWLNVCTKNRT